jgi:hypothetical protein
LKPRKRKTATSISSADFDSMTDEQLEAWLAESRKCPAGVPQELWDLTMKQDAEYIDSWKAEVTKHIREYDRTTASKKAITKRSRPKDR